MPRWAGPALVLAALALALVLRLWGIGRESLWLDEAFTYDFTSGSVAALCERTARDAHPPGFYLGVRAWRQAFGDSDAVLRGYSVLWSLIGLLAAGALGWALFGGAVGVLTMAALSVHPLDIYYAQELRMYSMTAALISLLALLYWGWLTCAFPPWTGKRMGWAAAVAACSTLLLYTHYLAVIALSVMGMLALTVFLWRRAWGDCLALGAAGGVAAVLFLPWMRYVLTFRSSLYWESLKWMTPSPWLEYLAPLGREYLWGMSSVIHDRLWLPGALIMGILTVAGVLLAWRRTPATRLQLLFVLALVVLPFLAAAVVTYIYNPVYARPRFAVLCLHPFLILAVAVGRAAGRVGITALILLFAAWSAGTVIQEKTQQKSDWREVARVWRTEGPPGLYVFMPPSNVVPVARYARIPVGITTPEQVSRFIPFMQGRELWVITEGDYPGERDAADAAFLRYLRSLGPERVIPVRPWITLRAIQVGEDRVPPSLADEFDWWTWPFDHAGKVTGFDEEHGFFGLEVGETSAMRWSAGRAVFKILNVEEACTVTLRMGCAPPAVENYRPDAKVYVARVPTDEALFAGAPAGEVGEFLAEDFELEMPVGAGKLPIRVGWTVNTVNLAKAGASADSRDLGLRLMWVGIRRSP
ncbi:MAG: hypothetical protein N2111_02850 [Candidatus Sumerlaeaceae bacterium]|nr:hypothetical protein [Candidatus Sumerlaeaceae bacterium]